MSGMLGLELLNGSRPGDTWIGISRYSFFSMG
jgi:hypothetical protein